MEKKKNNFYDSVEANGMQNEILNIFLFLRFLLSELVVAAWNFAVRTNANHHENIAFAFAHTCPSIFEEIQNFRIFVGPLSSLLNYDARRDYMFGVAKGGITQRHQMQCSEMVNNLHFRLTLKHQMKKTCAQRTVYSESMWLISRLRLCERNQSKIQTSARRCRAWAPTIDECGAGAIRVPQCAIHRIFRSLDQSPRDQSNCDNGWSCRDHSIACIQQFSWKCKCRRRLLSVNRPTADANYSL